MKNFNLFYFVFLLLGGCSCDHDGCRIDGTFFQGEGREEENDLKPWEKPCETVSGVKKEEVRFKHNFLTLDTQTLSSKEIILKKKREEEKKSISSNTP
ncbi:hypothetical protein IM40_00030 [Candidatus Paracaedimonas acanthamoebae]|nr:hypothetical protein IM40_00030 [Candidatus Paracaedimonas acanthamoebae]